MQLINTSCTALFSLSCLLARAWLIDNILWYSIWKQFIFRCFCCCCRNYFSFTFSFWHEHCFFIYYQHFTFSVNNETKRKFVIQHQHFHPLNLCYLPFWRCCWLFFYLWTGFKWIMANKIVMRIIYYTEIKHIFTRNRNQNW